MTESANNLDIVLAKITTETLQWKTNLTLDPTNQTQEVIFSQKFQNTNHPYLIFNHNTVNLTKSQKHPRLVLDSRLDLKEHLKKNDQRS